MKTCNLREYERDCPLIETHDKFLESWYFLIRMVEYYHREKLFRWYLDSFIQALRNTTFMLQSEGYKIPDFDAWYKEQQHRLAKNELLVNFKDARNATVKKGMLRGKSTVKLGIFRREKFLMGISDISADAFTDSEVLLQKAKSFYTSTFLGYEHSDINEQIGVERKWIIEEIGDGEISLLCYKAWREVGGVVEEAHRKLGIDFRFPIFEIDRLESKHILLESDLDDRLPEKWGWIDLKL